MKIIRMALNRRTFQTRALSAVVFVIVMVAGLIIHPWTFFLLFSLIHFGCWWEYQKLMGLIDPGYKEINNIHRYGIMLAGWSILLCFMSRQHLIFGMRLNEMAKWIGFAAILIILINEFFLVKPMRPRNLGHSLFGLIYISLSLGLMIELYNGIDLMVMDDVYVSIPGYFIPALIIGSIWINDTMAYIVGSFIGKHSLSKISPKKTWEGTVGGILITMMVAAVLSYYVFSAGQQVTVHIVGLAMVCAIGGTLGDLLESKLKRLAGVKDSGTLMPGHGGFLDRFDSLLVAIPFAWLYTLI